MLTGPVCRCLSAGPSGTGPFPCSNREGQRTLQQGPAIAQVPSCPLGGLQVLPWSLALLQGPTWTQALQQELQCSCRLQGDAH